MNGDELDTSASFTQLGLSLSSYLTCCFVIMVSIVLEMCEVVAMGR